VCRSALARYVDNGDGTITDNKTGLVWEQKLNCSDTSNPRCVNNFYSWSASTVDPDGPLYTDFLQKLNGLNLTGGEPCFASYCDWRIPTQGELRSILLAQYPPVCPSNPCIDPIFGPGLGRGYWSSSSLASTASNAWFVDFSNGVVYFGPKTTQFFARAVRGSR
jgi:hypothetical protein